MPGGIEVNRRTGPNGAVYVLINGRAESQSVTLPHAMQALLEETEVTQVVLPQSGVAVPSDARNR